MSAMYSFSLKTLAGTCIPITEFNVDFVCNFIKMKPLVKLQRVFTWLSVIPDENASSFKKLCYTAFTAIIFTSLFTYCFFSLVFISRNISVDLQKCLHALFQATATGALVYVMIVGCFSLREVRDIFKSLQAIYDTCKCSAGETVRSKSFNYLSLGVHSISFRWKWGFIPILGRGEQEVPCIVAEISDLCGELVCGHHDY